MRPRRITVTIGRIVVEGARPSRAALAAAVERELHAMLTAPGAAESLRSAGAVDRLDGGRVTAAGRGDAALGQAVAKATMGALKR